MDRLVATSNQDFLLQMGNPQGPAYIRKSDMHPTLTGDKFSSRLSQLLAEADEGPHLLRSEVKRFLVLKPGETTPVSDFVVTTHETPYTNVYGARGRRRTAIFHLRWLIRQLIDRKRWLRTTKLLRVSQFFDCSTWNNLATG